jgi:hypothetical protein
MGSELHTGSFYLEIYHLYINPRCQKLRKIPKNYVPVQAQILFRFAMRTKFCILLSATLVLDSFEQISFEQIYFPALNVGWQNLRLVHN